MEGDLACMHSVDFFCGFGCIIYCCLKMKKIASRANFNHIRMSESWQEIEIEIADPRNIYHSRKIMSLVILPNFYVDTL